jgi:hypothetical protein
LHNWWLSKKAQLHGNLEPLNGISVSLIVESVTKVYSDIQKLVKIVK